MMPAVVLLSSSLASNLPVEDLLRSSFCSLLSKSVAVYPEQSEGSHPDSYRDAAGILMDNKDKCFIDTPLTTHLPIAIGTPFTI